MRVLYRRADAVTPRAFVLTGRRGEGRAGQLFAIKTVIALLGRIHALRQGTGKGLGLKIIAKTGHVVSMSASQRGGFFRAVVAVLLISTIT